MIILRKIVAAATSILLVLISTPAVVEGTCKCKEVCPNWIYAVGGGRNLVWVPGPDSCWHNQKHCSDIPMPGTRCYAYCACNFFGCNCDPCGTCGSTRRMMLDDEENEENCDDFNSFTSLSAEGKRNSLAEKYCLEDDQVVREDIYEVLRDYAVLQYEGDVLTCAMFNKSYGDVDHLTLCENKHLKKGKKQKKMTP